MQQNDPSQTERDTGGERELVQKAQAGDRSAFNRLVLAHQDRIMTLCWRMLSDRHEAEEAAQDTFVRAFEHLDRFKGEAQFFTWLYRIAVNACRNRRRSWWWRVRRKAVALDEPADPDSDTPRRELGDTRMSPDKDLERHRTLAAIRKALATLPSIHRELIVLRDIDGREYEEIASILGVNLGTVKSRLARAREAMRAQLEGVVHAV